MESFKQKCVILIFLIQSEGLKDYMATISVDQSLSNSDFYEHRYLENIKKLYKSTGELTIIRSIKILLNQQWFPPLKNLLTEFHFHLINFLSGLICYIAFVFHLVS